MTKMSPKLILSALASTIAMAAFAIGAPSVQYDTQRGASTGPAMAELPVPAFTLPLSR